MILPPEVLYYFHVIAACGLAVLAGIASVFWLIRMRGVGGIAGSEFTAFFLLLSFDAIFQSLYPSAITAEQAILFACIAYLCINTGVLCIFLAGEYSTSDRPPPWRMTLLGLSYGIVWIFLMDSILSPPGTGMMFVSNAPGFGWVLYATPIYMVVNGLFAIGALGFFLEFCVKAYRAALPSTEFGSNARKLVLALVISLTVTGAGVGSGWIFTDFIAEMPALTLSLTGFFILYVFSLMAKNYRIMFFLPHKATCLFVLNTSGVVYYDHMFQTDEDPWATIDLFAPALAAVNFIIQESLQLKASDWISEFSTDNRTFLLEARADCELVGILLVSKPTQMLRRSLVHFIDHLSPIWRSNNNKLILDSEEIIKINQIIKDAFRFIPD